MRTRSLILIPALAALIAAPVARAQSATTDTAEIEKKLAADLDVADELMRGLANVRPEMDALIDQLPLERLAIVLRQWSAKGKRQIVGEDVLLKAYFKRGNVLVAAMEADAKRSDKKAVDETWRALETYCYNMNAASPKFVGCAMDLLYRGADVRNRCFPEDILRGPDLREKIKHPANADALPTATATPEAGK
jgi:hypothetical protein